MFFLTPPAIVYSPVALEPTKILEVNKQITPTIDRSRLSKQFIEGAKEASKLREELRAIWLSALTSGASEFEVNSLDSAQQEAELYNLRTLYISDLFRIWAVIDGTAESIIVDCIKLRIKQFKDENIQSQSILRSVFTTTKSAGTARLANRFLEAIQKEMNLVQSVPTL